MTAIPKMGEFYFEIRRSDFSETTYTVKITPAEFCGILKNLHDYASIVLIYWNYVMPNNFCIYGY